jgi:hypothetical protein
MSWSICVTGTPAVCRTVLAAQFAQAKAATQSIATEHVAVLGVEQIVEGHLDFLFNHKPDQAVTISACGSAFLTPPTEHYSGDADISISLTLHRAIPIRDDIE